jgi:ABC-type nitrate/sulfonate/bicarbonate transport system ATPase subunit
MTQMAKVFRLSFVKRLKYLWIPAVRPYLLSGSAVASGLAWKSGIAAEIIGIPDGSVGEVLFESKVYLDTETLLAWTVLIVALSIGTEKLFSLVLKGIFELCFKSPFPKKNKSEEKESKINTVVLSGVSKSFGEQKVLDDFSAEFSSGVTVLLGKSGSGKTTLLNIILGLETQDKGTVTGIPEKVSAVFQEDRLSNEFTPLGNVVAVTGNRISGDEILDVFEEMGINKSDALKKKIHKLSGGMKRRVALCRALCASGDLIVLDEPFKGLDDDTKDAVIETVKKYSAGKTVIMVTHDEEEAEKMGAEKILRI